jgi:hypothetical protein
MYKWNWRGQESEKGQKFNFFSFFFEQPKKKKIKNGIQMMRTLAKHANPLSVWIQRLG